MRARVVRREKSRMHGRRFKNIPLSTPGRRFSFSLGEKNGTHANNRTVASARKTPRATAVPSPAAGSTLAFRRGPGALGEIGADGSSSRSYTSARRNAAILGVSAIPRSLGFPRAGRGRGRGSRRPCDIWIRGVSRGSRAAASARQRDKPSAKSSRKFLEARALNHGARWPRSRVRYQREGTHRCEACMRERPPACSLARPLGLTSLPLPSVAGSTSRRIVLREQRGSSMLRRGPRSPPRVAAVLSSRGLTDRLLPFSHPLGRGRADPSRCRRPGSARTGPGTGPARDGAPRQRRPCRRSTRAIGRGDTADTRAYNTGGLTLGVNTRCAAVRDHGARRIDPQRAPAWPRVAADRAPNRRDFCLCGTSREIARSPAAGIHARSPITRMTGALAQVYRPSSPHGILRPDTSTISIFSVTWCAPAAANWSRRPRRRDHSPMRLRRTNVTRHPDGTPGVLCRRHDQLSARAISVGTLVPLFFSLSLSLSYTRQPENVTGDDHDRLRLDVPSSRCIIVCERRYLVGGRGIRHNVVIDSKVPATRSSVRRRATELTRREIREAFAHALLA